MRSYQDGFFKVSNNTNWALLMVNVNVNVEVYSLKSP